MELVEGTHTLELAFLRELWLAGGRAGQQNRYVLRRVEAVDPGRRAAAFEAKVEDFEARRVGGAAVFNATFDDPDGEKAALLARLKALFARTDALHRANLLLFFHSCDQATADSICANGFASVATRDNGYFGNGIYLTTCAQYACEYANGTIDGSQVPPNARGEHVVVASWVVPGLTYPLSRAVDYSPGVHVGGVHCSNFYQEPPRGPLALKPPFDSHYVAVQRGEYQCVDGLRNGHMPDYDELILKEAQQALPAFRLYFTDASA